MTKAELEKFRREVAAQTTRVLEIELVGALNRAKVAPDLASPRLMQTIVSIWRELWKRRVRAPKTYRVV